MPRLCEFFGIVIYVYHRDHAPPHFHAVYAGEDAVFDIATLGLVTGSCRPRVRTLVVEWAAQHQADLLRAWNQAQSGTRPSRIPPLE